MYIYNITFKVDHSIVKEWIKWQKEEHIPEIMATGLFKEFKFLHLLEHDDEEGATYIIQYHSPDKNNCDKYIKDHAPAFREGALKKWGDKIISYRSLFEPVQ
jgi:hypothetical protein